MAEPFEMPFGLWTRVGPRNHVLDGGPDPHGKRQFWGKGQLIVNYMYTDYHPCAVAMWLLSNYCDHLLLSGRITALARCDFLLQME